MNSATLCSLAGRYENPIPPRCLAPIDFLKIPALMLLQVVVMFGVVISIFMVCWLPYHVYFIFTYYQPQFLHKSYTGHYYKRKAFSNINDPTPFMSFHKRFQLFIVGKIYTRKFIIWIS
jgi:hypothetical protein